MDSSTIKARFAKAHQREHIIEAGNNLVLSDRGKFIVDKVIMDFFLI